MAFCNTIQGNYMTRTLIITDAHNSALGHGLDLLTISHTPFGYIRRPQHAASSVAFNGQHSESQSHHYLLGHGYRAYNPVLMRFHSPDNRSPFDRGGLNSYAYVAGDPINRLDPSGHMPLKPSKALIPLSPVLRRRSRSSPNLLDLPGSPASSRTYRDSGSPLSEHWSDPMTDDMSPVSSTEELNTYLGFIKKTEISRPYPIPDGVLPDHKQAMRTGAPLQHLALYSQPKNIEELKELGRLPKNFTPHATYKSHPVLMDFLHAANGRASSLTVEQGKRGIALYENKPYNDVLPERLKVLRLSEINSLNFSIESWGP